MIDMVLNKTGSLNIDLKGNTGKDIVNKISLRKYLEQFSEVFHIDRDIIIIIFNSRITNYFSFTFNMGGQRAQGNQAQNGSNMIYFLILIFVIYIFPLFFSK